ncbi:DUF6193 family natural product biosynthesis protein [Streptomyces sp. NPDC052396]|uniref:DUF6193 family natural product biosynthesis protein n=1 Tax=Streptomyces sp. NPDC052396 TaxID=3365689 RepID=UPI0037D54748
MKLEGPFGQPHPSSDTAVVETGRQAVRDDGRVRTELLEAAYAEPRLRQLFPCSLVESRR